VGKAAVHQVAGDLIEALAQQRTHRAKHWAANPYHRFNPCVLRRLLQGDQRANKRDEHRRAHLQTKAFGGQQVSTFVNEYQQDESERKPNAPKHGINPDRQNHGAAGFEQQRGVLDDGQQGKFELGEQRDNGHADWSQGLLQLVAEARPSRRRRRWREAVLGMFVLIHGRSLPESVRPARVLFVSLILFAP